MYCKTFFFFLQKLNSKETAGKITKYFVTSTTTKYIICVS